MASEIEINDRYLDVSFPDEDEWVFGCQAEPAYGDEVLRDYEDIVEVYTEKQAREIIEKMDAGEIIGNEWYATRNFDQSREGACVMNAWGQAHESCQAKQVGIENVIHISAMSLYQLGGSSASSGMSVSKGAELVQEVGFLPLDNKENREKFGSIVMPNTGFKTKRPVGWQAVAKRFLATEITRVRSVMGLVTAACKGDGVVIGREGHSIYYTRPMWRNGFMFGYWNSWLNWGQAAGNLPYGFGIDSINQVKKSASLGYAIRTVEIV